jgi:hypothetical protein
MRKRTCAILYGYSLYTSTVGIMVLTAAPEVFGPLGYIVLAVGIALWVRWYGRLWVRPKGRPGVWTLEMEVQRQLNLRKRWCEETGASEVSD